MLKFVDKQIKTLKCKEVKETIRVPVCPECGELAVKSKSQLITTDDVKEYWLKNEPGEFRYICPNNHHFDEEGNYRGNYMPEDITVRIDL